MENKERNEEILGLTCELMEKMNVEIEKAFVEDMEAEEGEEQILIGLTVANPGSLIGFKGRNLAAIQMVLSLAVKNRVGKWIRVLLDVNNYREEQKNRLEKMAEMAAEKVKQTGQAVVMMNMSSYERRICHMKVKEIEGVTSESEGEGEERHVVVKLKA